MSNANIKLVQVAYAAFGRGDIPACVAISRRTPAAGCRDLYVDQHPTMVAALTDSTSARSLPDSVSRPCRSSPATVRGSSP